MNFHNLRRFEAMVNWLQEGINYNCVYAKGNIHFTGCLLFCKPNLAKNLRTLSQDEPHVVESCVILKWQMITVSS